MKIKRKTKKTTLHKNIQDVFLCIYKYCENFSMILSTKKKNVKIEKDTALYLCDSK